MNKKITFLSEFVKLNYEITLALLYMYIILLAFLMRRRHISFYVITLFHQPKIISRMLYESLEKTLKMSIFCLAKCTGAIGAQTLTYRWRTWTARTGRSSSRKISAGRTVWPSTIRASVSTGSTPNWKWSSRFYWTVVTEEYVRLMILFFY